jgi:hypothetical protein
LIPPLVAAVLRSRAAPFDPIAILHIMAFVTLCEAYMGIDPHFNLRNYFFRVWLPQGSDMEVVVLGALSSMSSPGMALIITLTSPCLNPRTCGRKYSSFCAARSPCSQVTAPSPNPTRGTGWPRRTSASCSPCMRSFNNYDRRG